MDNHTNENYLAEFNQLADQIENWFENSWEEANEEVKSEWSQLWSNIKEVYFKLSANWNELVGDDVQAAKDRMDVLKEKATQSLLESID